ncbi:MAG: ABC transporter permease [Thermoanaerobaculia bacterium]
MIGSVFRASWMNFRRDRTALVLSFVVPIAFFSIFASIFGSRGGDTTSKVRIAVVDQEKSAQSRRLIEALRSEDALTVLESATDGPDKGVPFDRAAAETLVRNGVVPVALVIPKGSLAGAIRFSGPTEPGRKEIELIADTSDPIAPEIVTGLLQKSAFNALPDQFLAEGIGEIDQWSGGLTSDQRTRLDHNLEMLRKDLDAKPATGSKKTSSANGLLIPVHQTDILGADKKNPMIAFYAAGIGVMFLLFSAVNAGGALLEEEESGMLDRVLTTDVNMSRLLLGKMAYLVSLGTVQLCVMFLWGALVFQLDLAGHLAGFAIMAVTTAVASSAFGLLLATLCHTRAQLSAISTLTVLTISALGGSMFPRFLMPEALQKVGLIFFNSWAIEGFTRVFWREEPLGNLLPDVAVLILSAALFFAIARRFARRWETI